MAFFFLGMGFWHLLVLGNNFTSRKHPTILHSEPKQAFPQQLSFCLHLKGNSQVALYDNAVHFICIHSFSSIRLMVHFNSMETSTWSYAFQPIQSQPIQGRYRRSRLAMSGDNSDTEHGSGKESLES